MCGRWSTPVSSDAEELAVAGDAADGDAAEADAVIAALAADQALARALAADAVIGERDLERGIDRLRAGVGEEHMVEIAGQHGRRALEASSKARGWPIWKVGAKSILPTWSRTASTIFLRPWPAFTHHRPAVPSRILRPSWEV